MHPLCCLNSRKPLECNVDCTGEFELDDISSHVQISHPHCVNFREDPLEGLYHPKPKNLYVKSNT